MGWRKIKEADVVTGTVLRLANMADTPFNGATIIMVRDGVAKLARPMAYAHNDFDTNQPLLSCEVFDVSMSRLCGPNTDIEVFEGRDGVVRSMKT